MHLMCVVGARPQFIKLAPFSRETRRRGHRETVLHTGQHYDPEMSERFFEELGLPPPDVNLDVGSGSHARMTARVLEGVESEALARSPDAVVVFGDTNSTLGGALAATKLRVPAVHVEAGLRSFDRSMPEEINRVLTDHACDLLLAPNEVAMQNLEREGLAGRAVVVGDVMVDALLATRANAPPPSEVLVQLGVDAVPGAFTFATVHRAANTDDATRLAAILEALRGAEPVVFAVHPRTRHVLEREGIAVPVNVHTVRPLGYAETIALASGARAVVTDSGGLQKEAYLLGTPCISLRENTEWTETVELGWNVLVGADPARIRSALEVPPRGARRPPIYGDGHAARRMLDAIEQLLG